MYPVQVIITVRKNEVGWDGSRVTGRNAVGVWGLFVKAEKTEAVLDSAFPPVVWRWGRLASLLLEMWTEVL